MLTLPQILIILQMRKEERDLCRQECRRLFEVLQKNWVYQSYKKPQIKVCTSRLSSFDNIAQLDPNKREPYPTVLIQTNKENKRIQLCNEVIDVLGTNIDKEQDIDILKYFFLVLLCLVPDAHEIYDCVNDYFYGIQGDKDDKHRPVTQQYKKAFQQPFIDRICMYALETKATSAACLEVLLLSFYLQCNCT